MALEAFATSRPLTLGVELELQLVDTHGYDLCPSAADLLRVVTQPAAGDIKPEITSSMIEISTGICEDHAQVLAELGAIRSALQAACRRLNIGVCGGGTHPFQQWRERRIFDAPRFHHLSELYGYLAKQFTVFGQHVHIGCPAPDAALHLLHALSRFVPHFIALSASSPFVQGGDTGFQSARLNSINAFPLSGRAPWVTSWAQFEQFFAKMARTGVVESMKDFYWDIRPKPEYGTIEVRVMDTPLTVERAAALAAYIQAIARWVLVERGWEPAEDDYLVYSYNRFQACRFGLAGDLVDPRSGEHRSVGEDILATLAALPQHARELGCEAALAELGTAVAAGQSEADWLRQTQAQEQCLPEVVRQQCLRW